MGSKRNSPTTPLVVDANSFTSISKAVLQRANLEFERRYALMQVGDFSILDLKTMEKTAYY